MVLGSDSIGELRKTSERVAREAARGLLEEIDARATVDIHMADMLIPYVALAKGKSIYLARMITDHMESNMWLANEILGVEFSVEKTNGLFKIEKK